MELDFAICYICSRSKKPSMAKLGMCRFCYQSYCRTDGAGANKVAAMMWAADRARKLANKSP